MYPTPRYLFFVRSLFLGLLLALLFFPRAKSATNDLKEKISRKEKQIRENKKSLQELKHKEKEIYSEISGIRGRIKDLGSKLQQSRNRLKKIKLKINKLKQQNTDLQNKIKKAESEITRLIRKLWPLYLRLENRDLAIVDSLEENGRRFKWFSALFGYTREKIQRLKRQRRELTRNLAKQRRLCKSRESKLTELQDTKDRLLESKLGLSEKLRSVRSQKVSKKKQLEQIRETIQDLQYKLKLQRSRKIANLKGYLTWPVHGEQIVDFDKNAHPPREGIGFALDSRKEVQAISWGKVVYNDTLRGFGRVVILFHGQKYYSLYAFLSRSVVSVGKKVQRSEPIGIAGFYPKAEGPGMYFELRRGKKPVDPLSWLQDRE